MPLAGLRVLELAHVLSGPYCGMMLADLGADVIKIESPNRPDMMRASGAHVPGETDSLAFKTVNRSKRSLALDLTDSNDRAAFDNLVATADVLVQNYAPGAAERLGAGYSRTSAMNPRLIYVSISGFGAHGPLGGLGGYDLIAQAMSGLMSVTGEPDGEPMKAGVPITDITCALYATTGVLAALRSRDTCGHGQAVDCSLFDTGVAFSVWESAEYWASGIPPTRVGNAHQALSPYQPLRARDGWFAIGANNDDLFRRATSALGIPELAQDSRFLTNPDRLGNRIELAEALELVTALCDRSDVVRRLREVGVPCGEILDVGEALEHPHTQERRMVRYPSDTSGPSSHPVLGNPIHLSHTPIPDPAPAPLLDADAEATWHSVSPPERPNS